MTEAKPLAEAYLTSLRGEPCAVFEWSAVEARTHWRFHWNTIEAMEGRAPALKGFTHSVVPCLSTGYARTSSGKFFDEDDAASVDLFGGAALRRFRRWWAEYPSTDAMAQKLRRDMRRVQGAVRCAGDR